MRVFQQTNMFQHNCYCREDWGGGRVELSIMLQRSSTSFFVVGKMQIIQSLIHLISDLSHKIPSRQSVKKIFKFKSRWGY